MQPITLMEVPASPPVICLQLIDDTATLFDWQVCSLRREAADFDPLLLEPVLHAARLKRDRAMAGMSDTEQRGKQT